MILAGSRAAPFSFNFYVSIFEYYLRLSSLSVSYVLSCLLSYWPCRPVFHDSFEFDSSEARWLFTVFYLGLSTEEQPLVLFGILKVIKYLLFGRAFYMLFRHFLSFFVLQKV